LPDQQLPLERYVAGVLAGEAAVLRSDEALKAMAVAIRTYAVRLRGRHAAEGYDFCTSTHCQRLALAAITPRVEAAAAQTAGELLWFQGKLAFTPYSSNCGGRTEDIAQVWPGVSAPYLKGRDDPYCPRSSWHWSGDPGKIASALERAGLRTPHTLEAIAVAQRTASGRAAVLVLRGAGEFVRISASSFRFALGRELGWNTVQSERYEIGPNLAFEGVGAGHGVGLCQRGADRMGLDGRSWRDILAFYYPGTAAGATGRGFSWQMLSGESVTLWTNDPQLDRDVLPVAEHELHRLTSRLGWPAPQGTEIRLYPDVESFRNATGEPGWAAAHTSGHTIEMQPADVLRRRDALTETLRHELLHVVLQSQTTAALPLWFREGLVEYLEQPRHSAGAIHIPAELDLRQTSDQARARQAYADAARTVAALVGRYGEGTVLGWLKRGVPEEVTKTSSSHADRLNK
jgi:stage II sporulation protein D